MESNYSVLPSGFVILRLEAEEYNLSYILRSSTEELRMTVYWEELEPISKPSSRIHFGI